MSVKIRMTRMGRRHRPFFRINAIDSRAPRDGRILEKLGHYDPILKDVDKQVVIAVTATLAAIGAAGISGSGTRYHAHCT